MKNNGQFENGTMLTPQELINSSVPKYPPYTPPPLPNSVLSSQIRQYPPNWSNVFANCEHILEAILKKCGTTNAMDFGSFGVKVTRNAYAYAFAYMQRSLAERAIEGQKPLVSQMPYWFAVLYFSLSTPVPLRRKAGGTFTCKFANVKPPSYPPPLLEFMGPGDLTPGTTGFQVIPTYEVGTEAEQLEAFTLVCSRASGKIRMWNIGDPAPVDIYGGSQFSWAIEADCKTDLKGYTNLICSEFETTDRGFAACALVMKYPDTVDAPELLTKQAVMSYMHPGSMMGWLTVQGINRGPGAYPTPVYLDAADMMESVMGHFLAIDKVQALKSDSEEVLLHQCNIAGGATSFTAMVYDLISIAMGQFQPGIRPSNIAVDNDPVSPLMYTMPGGTQNIPRDKTRMASFPFFRMIVELLKSFTATVTNGDTGDQQNIPIVLSQDFRMQDLVASGTAGSWSYSEPDYLNEGQMTVFCSTTAETFKVAFAPPAVGKYREFYMFWVGSRSMYHGFTPMAMATDQKEVTRKLSQMIRMKPFVTIETISSMLVESKKVGSGGAADVHVKLLTAWLDKFCVNPMQRQYDQFVQVKRKRLLPPICPKMAARMALTAGIKPNVSLATCSLEGFKDSETVFLAQPLLFIPVRVSQFLEQSVNAVARRYDLPQFTLNHTPGEDLSESIRLTAAASVVDLYTDKGSTDELMTTLNRQDKLGLGGAMSFLGDVLLKIPALGSNQAASKIIHGLGTAGDTAIGFTKFGAANAAFDVALQLGADKNDSRSQPEKRMKATKPKAKPQTKAVPQPAPKKKPPPPPKKKNPYKDKPRNQKKK